MNSALRSPVFHRQTGVSLIELMISLALGVVLVLARENKPRLCT